MAKLKEIVISLGISMEHKGKWLKPNIGIKLELGEEDIDTRDRGSFDKVVKRAFEIVEDKLGDEIIALVDDSGSEDKAATPTSKGTD